jgi:RNA polymerase sigma factor (sigma-70 family)
LITPDKSVENLTAPTGDSDPPPGEVFQVVEHLFREESGKMVAILTRIFGIEHLNLAEDVVQEALVRALQTWPYYGLPKNPSAWIMQVSRNLALDVVRRDKVFRDKQTQIITSFEKEQTRPDEAVFSEHEIKDDRLRMIFVCCHPLLPAEAQVALALKTLCGFSVEEISRAFLTNEAAIAKRLTRARQKIRDEGIAFEIPTGDELGRRLDAVLQTLYLLFNEGYKASSGEALLRLELCQEAVRLTALLAQHNSGNQPRVHALLALMLLNAARFPTRTDNEGNLLRLKDQDRSRWDRAMIARGMFHLSQSAVGNEMTSYHLQAGIAACHCAAPDYASTDWPQIRALYDRLIQMDDSPVVALNRAVALSEVEGPDAGLEALAQTRQRDGMDSYYLFYAVQGEFEARLKRYDAASALFRKSIELTNLNSERAFLMKRLEGIQTQSCQSF